MTDGVLLDGLDAKQAPFPLWLTLTLVPSILSLSPTGCEQYDYGGRHLLFPPLAQIDWTFWSAFRRFTRTNFSSRCQIGRAIAQLSKEEKGAVLPHLDCDIMFWLRRQLKGSEWGEKKEVGWSNHVERGVLAESDPIVLIGSAARARVTSQSLPITDFLSPPVPHPVYIPFSCILLCLFPSLLVKTVEL